MGHIRALKEDLTAIGFLATAGAQQSWAPSYEAIATKKAAIAALKAAAKGAEVYLGSDDDREGEAIAWHTCVVLGLDPKVTPRVIFHEITEQALKQAVASPGRINMDKFNAQQARTMLDMLIGFTMSPCLWRSVGYKPGLSAGRCQTPALRIIYDRDLQIEAHKSTLSWKISCQSAHDLSWASSAPLEEEAALASLTALASAKKLLTVTERQERISTSQPPKPFITSSLQQEASSRLSMNPKITMKLAQNLYEAGYITYMRTDSPVLSQEAIEAASAIVSSRWGSNYLSLPDKETKLVKKVLKKKLATEVSGKPDTSQNAHEAIRPTQFELNELTDVGNQEQRLYKLIWTRAIQSIMAPETRDVVKLTASVSSVPDLIVETSWDQTRFAGYRILDAGKEDKAAEAALFEARKGLTKGLTIPWTVFHATEVRTSPPSRYTEASLIRDLETKGIGRPSTYASLVETVIDRAYVEKATILAQPVTVRGLELKATAKAPKATTKTEKAGAEKDKLRTTPLGRTVIEWLLSKFGDMLEYGFTAEMEAHLDEVAKGTRAWPSILQDTWSQYSDRYTVIMASPSSGSSSGSDSQASANKKDFGNGYKMVVSKKGPLFVHELEGQKTRFATVPASLSIQTASLEDAIAAFASTGSEGEVIGSLEDEPVTRKKGPYGFYVTWKEKRLTCKEDESFTEIAPRLQVTDTVDHQVGPYKIKKGPYGLYMFKTGGKTKPAFISIPDTIPWATLTPESAEEVYKQSSQAKKSKSKK